MLVARGTSMMTCVRVYAMQGGVEDKESAAHAAAREAWEEAGVEGRVVASLGVMKTKKGTCAAASVARWRRSTPTTTYLHRRSPALLPAACHQDVRGLGRSPQSALGARHRAPPPAEFVRTTTLPPRIPQARLNEAAMVVRRRPMLRILRAATLSTTIQERTLSGPALPEYSPLEPPIKHGGGGSSGSHKRLRPVDPNRPSSSAGPAQPTPLVATKRAKAAAKVSAVAAPAVRSKPMPSHHRAGHDDHHHHDDGVGGGGGGGDDDDNDDDSCSCSCCSCSCCDESAGAPTATTPTPAEGSAPTKGKRAQKDEVCVCLFGAHTDVCAGPGEEKREEGQDTRQVEAAGATRRRALDLSSPHPSHALLAYLCDDIVNRNRRACSFRCVFRSVVLSVHPCRVLWEKRTIGKDFWASHCFTQHIVFSTLSGRMHAWRRRGARDAHMAPVRNSR